MGASHNSNTWLSHGRGKCHGQHHTSPPDWRLHRRLGLRFRFGLRRQRHFRTELAGGELVVPPIGDGDLVATRVARAKLDHLRAVPIPVPVILGFAPGHLHDAVAIVAVAVDRVSSGAVAKRYWGDLRHAQGEGVLPQHGRIPLDPHDSGHQAPTSACIAPGPGTVLPWPSSDAPTRIEILPQCLFSFINWWASGTPSKPIVRHSTGRILPCS